MLFCYVFLAISIDFAAAQGRSSTSDSISPDRRWEYRCRPYADDTECAPELVRAGTTKIVVDLQQDLEVSGSESIDAKVFWAPDSKRFAFNYRPVHAHHTTCETVAFYQLNGDKWVQLASPLEAMQQSQLVELARNHSLKGFTLSKCAAERDVLKLRRWVDTNTAILYAPCYPRNSGRPETGLLFTLKFDDAGKWKIVNTRRMSKDELEQQQQ